ncbi:response regulator [Limnohabitans sp.]|uniref:response regulator n=1 Tax=Limnohabitans sp. TaxID=1907725 RepID=UPI0038BC26BD
MATLSIKEPYDGYCGTSYAAKVLGISVGTVQGLVEKNDLRAWKTQGGHRRISLQSIQEYQRRHNLSQASSSATEDCLRVLVVEDDENTRLMLQANFEKWGLPIDAVMYASAMEALLDMPSLQPQVLLTDLRMPNVDGFQFLKTLSQHALFSSLAIVAITGMSAKEVQAKGGLPDGVQLLQKPIDLDWLRGFFDALMSMRQINRRSRV